MRVGSSLRQIGLALVVVSLLFLAGCRSSVDVSQPPDIVCGRDPCDRCKMLISEENMAAAYWTTAGEARRFDDIGEMLAYQKETGDDVATWWVHDLTSGDWLKAEDAHFVIGAGVATPMGFGIVAFSDENVAETLALGVENALVLDFSGLRVQPVRSMMTHDDLN